MWPLSIAIIGSETALKKQKLCVLLQQLSVAGLQANLKDPRSEPIGWLWIISKKARRVIVDIRSSDLRAEGATVELSSTPKSEALELKKEPARQEMKP